MFGLFKSKKDKEVDKLIKTLRTAQESIYYNGNMVEDLATDIKQRYKLTVSTIESISYPGLLTPDINNSGYVVIAINKNEVVYVNYQKSSGETRVEIGRIPDGMLQEIQEGLIKYTKEAKENRGMAYSVDWINIVGAITVLGYEVGIYEDEEDLYMPFYYNDSKFYIVYSDNKSWIVFSENTTENINDNSIIGQSSVKQSAEDNLLESIKELKESEGFIYSIRLKLKNFTEVDKVLNNLGIEYFSKNDMIYLIVDNKVYGISEEEDDAHISITGFDDDYNDMDFQALKEGIYLGGR